MLVAAGPRRMRLGINVEGELPGSTPVIMADRNQLKQVFFNITKNAMEAMQPGGRLKIKSRADDDSVYLLFGDSGSGIRQEDLVKLFQPYYTTKAGGHGLGLMIVRKKALSQIAGLIIMENGVYLAALVATLGLPIAVELGVFFDLLVGVLLLGVFAYRINQTFDTINTDRLRALRG